MRVSSVVMPTALVLCLAPFRSAVHVAPADACALLTSAQINGVMGGDMGTPRSIASKACQWRRPAKAGDPTTMVDVTILDRRRFDIGKAAAGSTRFKVTPISGLGDEAYSSASSDGKMVDLRVRKGEEGFAVHVWGTAVPIAELEPRELAIAKIIAPKF